MRWCAGGRCAGTQVHRCACAPVRRCAGAPVRRCAGAPAMEVEKGSKLLDCRRFYSARSMHGASHGASYGASHGTSHGASHARAPMRWCAGGRCAATPVHRCACAPVRRCAGAPVRRCAGAPATEVEKGSKPLYCRRFQCAIPRSCAHKWRQKKAPNCETVDDFTVRFPVTVGQI